MNSATEPSSSATKFVFVHSTKTTLSIHSATEEGELGRQKKSNEKIELAHKIGTQKMYIIVIFLKK